MSKRAAKSLPVGLPHLEWLARCLGMPDAAQDELTRDLPPIEVLSCPEGFEIVREGGTDDDLFILYRGIATVHRTGKRLAELMPGDLFGEMSFLVGVPRTATVKAGKGCEVFRIHPGDLEEFLNRNKKLLADLRATAKSRMLRLHSES